MRSRSVCCSEVVPFLVMAFVQCSQVALSTLFKKASRDGISYLIFILYSYAIAGLVLLPFALFFERSKKLPPVDKVVVGRFILLGFLGYVTQLLGFKGIEYSSPTMASSMSSLTPAVTFVLAILFRMEKVKIGSLSSRAKIAGTLISVAGALVVVLYQGPAVTAGRSPGLSLSSAHSNWVTGGLLLIADYILFPLWYIVQTEAVGQFPEMLLVSIYNLCVAAMAAPVTLYAEPHVAAWKMRSGSMLLAILFNGLFGSSFATVLLTWGLHVKGPVYVALFTPLSIVIAAIMGVIFLGDSLFLGTVIGAVTISIGFYLCIWGKAKEEGMEEEEEFGFDSGSAQRAPLLH